MQETLTANIKADLLIVDDVPENLRLLNNVLSQYYKVRLAPSGAAGLAAAFSRIPDLILLDIMMPEIGGYEVAARLKANPSTADVPIIFMSALDDIGSKMNGFAAGGVDYITKPFQELEVLARVKTHLSISTLYKQAREEIVERKRLEEQLLLNEEHYRLLAENISDVIWVLNLDQKRFTYISPSVEQLRGYTAEEALAQTMEESLTPDSIRIVSEKLAKNVPLFLANPETARTHVMEVQQLCKNGEIIWVEVSLQFRFNSSRQLEALGVSRNIETRKKAERELQRSEERHRLLADNATDLIMTFDTDGRITYVSPSVEKLRGYTPAEVVQQSLEDFLAPEAAEKTRAGFAQTAAALQAGMHVPDFHDELEQKCKDGSWIWTDVTMTGMVKDSGEYIGMLAVCRNIHKRKQTERMLHSTKERLEAVLNALPDLMFRVDRFGTFLESHALDDSLYYIPPSEFLGKRIADIFPPEVSRVMLAGLERANATGMDRGAVYSLPSPQGASWFEHSIARMKGQADSDRQFIILIRDITERKRQEEELMQAHADLAAANLELKETNEKLKRLATTDPLTGIWNRRLIEEFVEVEIAQARRYSMPLTLLMLDIDHFKSVNDQYGHKAGDQVLVDVSQTIRSNLRAADRLARWGGEEFVVVMPHCRAADAQALAEKLRALIGAQPFSEAVRVTVSIGVAELQAGEALNEWLKRADQAMYAAKSAGRNAVCLG